MELELDGWKINVLVDDDGMLEVCLSHNDESDIIPTDTDKWGAHEWGERFTTKQMENDHREESRKIRHRGQRKRNS